MGLSTAESFDKGVVQEVEVVGRPSNIIWRLNNRSFWWQFYSLMDFYRSEVSILDTIISRSVTEIFRYGIDFEPAFVVKCVDCGNEYQNNVKVCPYCNSTRLVKPEEKQKDYFVRPDGTSFLEECNENQQSLKDLCRMYAESQYQNNQAYLLVITGDVIDNETKQLKHSYPLEFICIDPKFVRYLYDEHAEPGELYGFTMNDRRTLITLPHDGDLVTTTPDGEVIYPAYWQVGDSFGAGGPYISYTKDEIYQNHWFRQSMTYGIPHWLSIEDDLLTYHYIEKHNLKKYKYGYVRKIVVLPGYDVNVIKDVAQGIQNVLAKNDNSVPIVGLPPAPPGTSPQPASTLEMGAESGSDLIQTKNDIRDRLCAHAGVPNLFAGDVENGGGLNNESQQITTFDRYLMDKYDYTDDMLDWILSWFPKITDWKLRVKRPSKADQANKQLQEEIQIAQGMKNLGFQITYTNGEFTYSEKPVDMGMGMGGMGGGMDPAQNTDIGFRGMLGAGGLGNDTEQMDTKGEVGEYEDDAYQQYQASKDAKLRKAGSSFRLSQGDLRRAISQIHR
jgi:DNA-directed RNA polymerase subunit RPC12/RpoP